MYSIIFNNTSKEECIALVLEAYSCDFFFKFPCMCWLSG